MSGSWVGSCASAKRPVTPSPLRTGAVISVSTSPPQGARWRAARTLHPARHTRRSRRHPPRQAGSLARRSSGAPSPDPVSPGHEDGTDRIALAQHRHREQAPEPEYSSDLPHVFSHRRVLDVWQMDDRLRQNCRSRRGFHAQGPRILRADSSEHLRSAAVVCRVVQRRPVGQEDGRIGRVTEPSGTPHDRVEDRLRVGLRVGNGSEDLTRRRLLLQRSVSERCRAAYDGAGWAPPSRAGGTYRPPTELLTPGILLLAPGAFHAHSPRAGRGSGLATIARGLGWVNDRSVGLRLVHATRGTR
jgi:hypothetical protein